MTEVLHDLGEDEAAFEPLFLLPDLLEVDDDHMAGLDLPEAVDARWDSTDEEVLSTLDAETPATNMNSLSLYLRDVGKVPLLSGAEEVSLAKRIEQGDESAKQQLVEANLRLVVHIAKGYRNCGVPFLDLIQEGTLGAIRAAELFDWRKGNKFSTYATGWITRWIIGCLQDQGRNARVPRYEMARIETMKRAERFVHLELLGGQRLPSIEETAEFMELAPDKVSHLKRLKRKEASLHTPVGEDKNSTALDFLPDTSLVDIKDIVASSLEAEALHGTLGVLTPDELDVMAYRFGLFSEDVKSLELIGNRLNITRGQVRKLEKIAVDKLRAAHVFKEPHHAHDEISSLGRTAISNVDFIDKQRQAFDEARATDKMPANLWHNPDGSLRFDEETLGAEF